jgi:hypothetical protein
MPRRSSGACATSLEDGRRFCACGPRPACESDKRPRRTLPTHLGPRRTARENFPRGKRISYGAGESPKGETIFPPRKTISRAAGECPTALANDQRRTRSSEVPGEFPSARENVPRAKQISRPAGNSPKARENVLGRGREATAVIPRGQPALIRQCPLSAFLFERHNGPTLNGRPGADHTCELKGPFRRAGPFQRTHAIPLPIREDRGGVPYHRRIAWESVGSSRWTWASSRRWRA